MSCRSLCCHQKEGEPNEHFWQALVAAGDRGGHGQRGWGADRDVVRTGHSGRPRLARQPAGAPGGPGAVRQARPFRAGGRRAAAVDHRERGPVLPAAGGEQVAGRDGSAHLAARQPGWCRSRPVLCRFRQPDPGTGGAGGWPAELGHRRDQLPLAAAQVGGCPGRSQPGVARCHLGAPGRRGSPPLAPTGRWLPATARRLGDVPRPRRGGHEGRGRGPAHYRRRFAAGFLGERARIRSPAGRPRHHRFRQQRHGRRGHHHGGPRP